MGSPVVTITPDAAPAPQGVTITPDPPKKSVTQSVEDFAKEWWNQVNPVTALTGARDMVSHPIDTANKMADAQAAVLDKAKDAFKNGRYAEGVRHSLNYMIPILGPQTDRAGDLADQGEFAKSAGATAGIATNIAAPEAITKLSYAAPSVRTALQPAAERLYQSALKPPPAQYSSAEVGNMVKTGLKEQIPISEEGAAKISTLVSDLSDKVKAQIQAGANSGQTVNKFSVASRLGDTARKFSNQVSPTADLKAVSETGNDFLATQPGKIPVDIAQDLKKGTYQQLSSKAYGEVGSATTEAQKALARGLKEELEAQFPEIKGNNARVGRLLDLDEVLQRAVRREANKQVLPIAGPITGGVVSAATGSGPAGVAAFVLKTVLDHPELKSRLAIAISKGSGITMGAANARVAAYASALARATTSDGSGDQSNGQQGSTPK